jgi:predicted nucleic acid-binding protein
VEGLVALRGQVVGLDTAPLIYFMEENPTYLATVRPFFEAMDRGEFSVITSMVTLLEVLVHPFRCGNADLVQQYRDILLSAEHLTTIGLSQDIAEEAARLRATPNLRTPDAIQLATAIHTSAAYFLTNDDRYPMVPGVRI